MCLTIYKYIYILKAYVWSRSYNDAVEDKSIGQPWHPHKMSTHIAQSHMPYGYNLQSQQTTAFTNKSRQPVKGSLCTQLQHIVQCTSLFMSYYAIGACSAGILCWAVSTSIAHNAIIIYHYDSMCIKQNGSALVVFNFVGKPQMPHQCICRMMGCWWVPLTYLPNADGYQVTK